jgi:RNA polymerase sigma-70 factor (ECF subfamily)
MQTLSPAHGEQTVTQQVPPARTRRSTDDALGVADAEAAYAAFFRVHFTGVVRTVHLIVHDRQRAEDISQDAFVQLLRNWAKVSAYERPDAWVRRVAIRLAVRGLRRDALWTTVRSFFVPRAPAEGSDPDLIEAIGRLPNAQRAAIVLHYYEDRPVAEVAALLGCAEATARVHLHRGRRRLAQLLGEEEDDATRR